MDITDTRWVARWVVSTQDALIDNDSRQEIEDRLKTLIAAHPQWFAFWFSGYLSDIVRSLNPEDPWHKLSIVEGTAFHPDGNRFGSSHDSADLARPAAKDLRGDIGLAALAPGLADEPALLIAAAAKGRDPVLTWCERNMVMAPILTDEDAHALFAVITSALRWAMHRRRLYMGPDDPFAHVNGVAWIERTNRYRSGSGWDESHAARILADSSVPLGTYALLV